jgi:hypothetical protein
MAGRKWLRWSLIVFAVIVLLAVGTLTLLPRLVDTAAFRAHVAQAAGQVVGRPVKFASLSVSLLPLPNVTLRGLEIADDPRFGTSPVLRVGEVQVRVRLRPLLSLRIELASITLDKAQVELVEAGGRWNVATLAAAALPAKTAPRAVPGIPGATAADGVMVSRISLTNAVVHVKRLGNKHGDVRIQDINATVTGVGGADLDIRGEARVEPGGFKLRDLRITVGTRAGDMPVKASLDLEGADIAPLARVFFAASPEVSGPVKGTLQVSGALARLGATGQLVLSRVTLSEVRRSCAPPTRRQLAFDDVRVPVLLKPAAFESAPLSAKLGKGSVALTFTAGLTDPSPLLNLTHITIGGVELLPVLQGYLCQGFAVSGPLDLGGELSMRTADVWRSMNGTGRLKIGKGRVVGEGALKLVRDVLEAGMVVDQALRGKFSGPSKTALDFDSITGSYRITAGVVRTDDLLYQGKDLKVMAAGTYALVDGRTDMNVVATQGSSQLRAQVTGSGGSLRVIPTGVKVKEAEQIRKLLDRLLR